MTGRIVRFGHFEVNFSRRELRHNGARVPLQEKPFRVLELLLREPGAVVSRNELIQYLWPDSHVAFAHGLNTAVNSLRQALGESSRSSDFIETLPGLGYSFIAPVEEVIAQVRDLRSAGEGSSRGVNEDYLKGRFLLDRLNCEDSYKAIGFFTSALSVDKNRALSLAGIADASCQLALLGSSNLESLSQRATDAVQAALLSNSELCETQVAAARVKLVFTWDWLRCEEHISKAVNLNPKSPECYLVQSSYLLALGRCYEAVESAKRAAELDPLSSAASVQLSLSLLGAGNFQAAVARCWEMLSLNPQFRHAQLILALAYEQLDCFEEAFDEFRNARLSRDLESSATLGLVHALLRAGRQDDAEQILSGIKLAGEADYGRALLHLANGYTNRALAAVDRLIEARHPVMLGFLADPRWSAARSGPTFEGCIARLKGKHPISELVRCHGEGSRGG